MFSHDEGKKGYSLHNHQNVLKECPASCPLKQLAEELKLQKKASPREEFASKWLDTYDLSEMLHLSKRTLQTMRSNGTLPSTRFGKKVYYRYEDIERILSDNYLCNLYGIDRSKR